ncbi:hypothetical protein [Parasphingopyxis marina]|uniref:Uncharacterized protein n=1 Tax=Parasphingopyxis marina TaxID=2761622 RepID=A0A842I124_9SPHN|nr:hypothetical protein [Parasphingopyxis marina]MBC2778421.1 hypothetical protein [Parasphingopyxis marina]
MNLSLDTIRNGVSWPDVMAKLPKVPVASAISGLIVAALILMIPNPLFEAFIVRTGLPDIFSAAEPPLGARARIYLALIAALIVTTGAWIALSVVVGRKRRTPRADFGYHYDAEEAEEQPVRRRADFHPDAPYRRPIMAGDDLGAPLDLVDVVPEDFEEEEPLELSMADILEDEVPAAEEAEPEIAEPEPAPQPALEPELESEFAQAPEADEEPLAADPVAEPVAEESDEEPIFTVPLRPRETEAAQAPEPTQEPLAEPVVQPAPVQAEAKPQPGDARAELAELVTRLEAGLERRRAHKGGTAQAASQTESPATSPATSNVTPHPVAEPGNDREAALREALDALQKLTAKGA